MSWEDAAIISHEVLEKSPNIIQEFESRGIPISPDYLVEMEQCGDKFVYKWKRKHGKENS